MPQPYKIEKVEEFRKLVDGAKSIVFTDYRGMTVEEMTALRTKLRETNTVYSVIKNNLFKIAIKDTTYVKDTEQVLEGTVAVAINHTDGIAPLKTLTEFAKQSKKMVLKAVVLDGRYFPEDQIEALSKLPSKQQILGMLVNVLQSPVRRLTTALRSPAQKLVGVMNAVAEKKS